MNRNAMTNDLLESLTPQDVRAYAKATGWERRSDVNGLVALFERPGSDVDQLIVPIDTSLHDYARRMRDVVIGISEFERRSPEDVLAELLTPGADVIRYRVTSPSTEGGTLALDDGIRLLEGAKKSILAAACSVIAPTTHHPRMTRSEATQLAGSCQLGQTERGSFAVALICPIRNAEQQEFPFNDVDSFTRRTTTLLMQSVARLVAAIDADDVARACRAAEGKPTLSANLCDALLRMQPAEKKSALTLSATWAKTLPRETTAGVADEVRVRHEHFPVIEEVYRNLLPTKEPQNSLFVGYVDALNGNPDDDGRMRGETVLGLMHDEEMVTARVDLAPDDYQTAVEAHRHNRIIKVRGTLHLGRRAHRITDVGEFSLIAD